jgi:hypothetical protein
MSKEMIRIKATEGLCIFHLIDEDWDYPVCITRGDYPSIKNPLGNPSSRPGGRKEGVPLIATFEAPTESQRVADMATEIAAERSARRNG